MSNEIKLHYVPASNRGERKNTEGSRGAGDSQNSNKAKNNSGDNTNTNNDNNTNNNSVPSDAEKDQQYFDILAAKYRPTPEECKQLAAPVNFFLGQCSCYDMLSISTQVVVLDVDAPLAVAFIAAQETRVQSCVLWDTVRKAYVGVLTSTDYIQILLYCVAKPSEADAVSTWTIREWRKMKSKLGTTLTVKSKTAPSAGGASQPEEIKVDISKKGRPDGLVSCSTDTILSDCLELMHDKNVRRIVALAEKEGESFSIVSMMDVEQIVEFLGVMFFFIEKNSKTVKSGDGDDDKFDDSMSSDSNNSSFAGSSRQSSSSAKSISGSGTDLLTPEGEKEKKKRRSHKKKKKNMNIFAIGDTLLSPKLTEMLSQAGENYAHHETCVGPYASIFDIPFCYTPSYLGIHRDNASIYVLLDNELHNAFSKMLYYDVESIAVVNNAQELLIVDVISRSDLLRMEDQGVYNTSLTVREALASKLKEKIFVCYATDTLREIFAHFAHQRVKELFIVDPDSGKLVGQLNIAEFVFFLAFGYGKKEKK